MHDVADFYHRASEEVAVSPEFQQKILSDFLKDLAKVFRGHRVFDLGSGVGLNLGSLHRHFSSVVAGDISVKAIHASRRDHGSERTAFLILDGRALPFAKGSFDLVVCTEVLEHVTDLGTAIAEIHRVLKGGGYVILSTPSYCNPVGLLKWIKDKVAGKEYWEPWGAHRDGFERHVTARLLKRAMRSFTIVQTRGAGFLLPWFFGTPLAKYHGRFPLLGLGKLPLLKKHGMHYYVLAKKGR